MSASSFHEWRDLSAFFHPRSVVLVGGSNRSAWSHLIFGNLRTIGFEGRIHIVNQRGTEAHGLQGYTSCTQLPEAADLAYVFVPQAATPEALEDVGNAGIRNVILLTSGYAEAGAEGVARQNEIAAIVRRFGMNLLGPNGLGYINYPARVALAGFPVDERVRPGGGIAVISQSGATAHVISRFARQQGIGLSTVVATGNEADIAVHDVIAHLATDPDTRAIALFIEGIRNTAAFLRAVKLAQENDKPVVALKVGRSSLATKLAQAHTGSVTGDDRVFDTICKQHNIIRVDSIEALATTAGLLAATGRINGGVAIASISGGACEIIADRAEAVGLNLPELAPETKARLQDLLPEFGSVNNPLDVTGAAVREPELFEKMLKALADDPAVELVACIQDLPSDEADTYVPELMTSVGKGLAGGRRPGLLISQAMRPQGAFSREVMEKCGITMAISGIDHGIAALAAAQRWSAARRSAERPLPALADARPGSEREALAYLAGAGVGVIPHRLATSADEAAAIWESLGRGRVVLKVASPDIAHKSDIGGVKLRLDSAEAVRSAFDEIMAAAKAACPEAKIEGCIVAPMREGGIEIFVGTARTAWGPVIAAGLGGVWIEALADTSLRLLPITKEDALDMLDELKGRRLLDGYRGAPAVDRDALAATIVRIGDAALALGPDLVSLEVNPMLARGNSVEALDALVLWDEASAPEEKTWSVA